MEIKPILARIPLKKYIATFELIKGDNIVRIEDECEVPYVLDSILNAKQLLVKYVSDHGKCVIVSIPDDEVYIEVAVIRKVDLPQPYIEQLNLFE